MEHYRRDPLSWDKPAWCVLRPITTIPGRRKVDRQSPRIPEHDLHGMLYSIPPSEVLTLD